MWPQKTNTTIGASAEDQGAQPTAAPQALHLAAMRFLLDIRKRGVTDHALLSALESTWRPDFLPAPLAMLAYTDQLLPIAAGQHAESPHVLANNLQLLQVSSHHRVLEVGTGTGYSATLLAKIARRVYSLERSHKLHAWAEQRIPASLQSQLSLHLHDGREGFVAQAPFDRILVNAFADKPPSALIEQLAEGGRCLIPIGDGRGRPMLWLVRREHGLIHEFPVAPMRSSRLGEGLMRAL